MAILLPDTEGAWICEKHKKERGHQIHGSNCYRCIKAENEKLRNAVEEAKEKRQHYREIIEALMVPTNFISIEAARSYICEAVESYGLGIVEAGATAKEK